MVLLELVLALAAVGVVLYLVEKFLPMNEKIRDLMVTVVFIGCVAYVILWFIDILGFASFPVHFLPRGR